MDGVTVTGSSVGGAGQLAGSAGNVGARCFSSPDTGGFVCNASSSVEWVGAVASMWKAYYQTPSVGWWCLHGDELCGAACGVHCGVDGACDETAGLAGGAGGSDVSWSFPRVRGKVGQLACGGCRVLVDSGGGTNECVGLDSSGQQDDGVKGSSRGSLGFMGDRVVVASVPTEVDGNRAALALGSGSNLSNSPGGGSVVSGGLGAGAVVGFKAIVAESVGQQESPVCEVSCDLKEVSAVHGNVVHSFATKTEFNRHRRKERKERLKNRKKEELSVGASGLRVVGSCEETSGGVPEWRRKSVDGQGSKGVRVGYFSDLSEDVQRELKDSRARLLIEKNKRELRQEQEKLKSLDCESPEYLVRKMIEVTALANVLKKKTTDDRVGGWAETVADSLTKSVAASAPSSVPSLESVGYGKSSLEASVGSSSTREAEFLKEKDSLENHYLKADSFLPSDYKADLDDLKQQYADVLYEPAIAKRVTAYKTACDLMRSEAFDEKTSMGMARGISKEFEDVIVMFENSGYGDILI